MVTLAWLVALAGCGRIGFGTVGTDGTSVEGSSTPTVNVLSNPTAQASELITVNVATGAVTSIGTISQLGLLGGLAYWDSNTLYATSTTGNVVRITLSPFGATVIQTFTGGISELDSDGARLIGVNDNDDTLVTFVPGGAMSATPIRDLSNMAVPGGGGDIARMPDGSWVWWTQGVNQLFRLDVGTGRATPIGAADSAAPSFSGLVQLGGHLFLTDSSNSGIVEIDPLTGTRSAELPLCMPCPGTPYHLSAGDATRTP